MGIYLNYFILNHEYILMFLTHAPEKCMGFLLFNIHHYYFLIIYFKVHMFSINIKKKFGIFLTIIS